MKTTVEAQKTIVWLKEYTTDWPQIKTRLEAMIENREAEMVTTGLIVYVIRNLSKAQIPMGQESEPPSNMGYPDGWTQLV